MPVAPTHVASVSTAHDSTTTPKTASSLTVQVGDLLVLIASASHSSSNWQSGPPAVAGGAAVTWTMQQDAILNDYSDVRLYTGAVTTAGTATVSFGTSPAEQRFGFILSQWRDHGGVGVSGKASSPSGAPALTLNCSALSSVVYGVADWDVVSGTATHRSVDGSTPTVIFNQAAGSWHRAYYARTGSVGTAGNKTVGMTSPSSQKYQIVGVEILAGADPIPPTTPANVAVVPGNPNTTVSWTPDAVATSYEVKVVDLTPPETPTGVTVVPGYPDSTVSWTPVTDATSYEVRVVYEPEADLALTGSGTLSCSGRVVANSGLTLSGSGVLGLAGKPSRTSPLALTGLGSLTTSTRLSVSASLARTGSGSLGTDGRPTPSQALLLSGSGTLNMETDAVVGAVAALNGSGTLTMQGTAAQVATLNLSSEGLLEFQRVVAFSDSVSSAGEGVLSLSGQVHREDTLTRTGSGALTTESTGVQVLAAEVSLGASGDLTLEASTEPTVSLFLGGDGALVIEGQAVTARGDVLLSSEGHFGFESDHIVVRGATILDGEGDLHTAGGPSSVSPLLLDGAGLLELDAEQPTVSDTLERTGSGSLDLTGRPTPVSALALSSSGSLSLTATAHPEAVVSLSGSGSLSFVSGTLVAGDTLALTGSGTLTTSRTVDVSGTVTRTGTGELSLIGGVVNASTGMVILSSTGLLEATGYTPGGIVRGDGQMMTPYVLVGSTLVKLKNPQ